MSLFYCPECEKKFGVGISFGVKGGYCPWHGNIRLTKEYILTANEASYIITVVPRNNDIIEAMDKLKRENIIEFAEKMGNIKAQAEQIRAARKVEENKPKCPTCGSTNLTRISALKKATKVGLFGIFGAGDIGKTWKCNNCGSRF